MPIRVSEKTRKGVEDFDNFIILLNLQLKIELGIYLDECKNYSEDWHQVAELLGANTRGTGNRERVYENQEHAHVNRFYDELKARMYKNNEKREELLGKSKWDSTMSGKTVSAILPTLIGGAGVGSGLAGTIVSAAGVATAAATAAVAAGVGGTVVLSGTAIAGVNIGAKYAYVHMKKHEAEVMKASKAYHDDNIHLVELSLLLLTLYNREELRRGKIMDRTDINNQLIDKLAKKESAYLDKSFVKLEKDEKGSSGLISKVLLPDYISSSEVFQVKELRSTLDHWLGAVEKTMEKEPMYILSKYRVDPFIGPKKANKRRDERTHDQEIFLKELSEQRQNTEYDQFKHVMDLSQKLAELCQKTKQDIAGILTEICELYPKLQDREAALEHVLEQYEQTKGQDMLEILGQYTKQDKVSSTTVNKGPLPSSTGLNFFSKKPDKGETPNHDKGETPNKGAKIG